MGDVATDLSADGLRRVSEDNYAASFTCFSVVPEVEVHMGPDMIRILSPGVPNWLTNNVLRCRLADGDADAAIDDTNRYFVSQGVEPRWRLGPSDAPSDLGERLVKKGFTLEAEHRAMTADLKELPEDIATPDGLTIERIANLAMLKKNHVWIRRLGEGKSLGTLLVDLWSAYGFGPDSIWQNYVALRNEAPVSNASVFCATGVVGIYGVVTVPEARRQGIGAAITLRALLDARQRGFRVGVLQSTKMGYNVYRRLGFQTSFAYRIYALASASFV